MDPITLALMAQMMGGGAPGQQKMGVGQGLAALGSQQSQQPAPGLAGGLNAGLSGLAGGAGMGMQAQGMQQLQDFLRQPHPPLGALQMGQGPGGINPMASGGLTWGG